MRGSSLTTGKDKDMSAIGMEQPWFEQLYSCLMSGTTTQVYDMGQIKTYPLLNARLK